MAFKNLFCSWLGQTLEKRFEKVQKVSLFSDFHLLCCDRSILRGCVSHGFSLAMAPKYHRESTVLRKKRLGWVHCFLDQLQLRYMETGLFSVPVHSVGKVWHSYLIAMQ